MFSTAAMRKMFQELFEIENFETDRCGLNVPLNERAAWIPKLVERLKSIDRVNCYPYWQVPEGAPQAAIKFTINPPESTVADEKRTRPKQEWFLLTLDCRVFVHNKQVTKRRGGTRSYVDVSITNGPQRDGLWIVDASPKRCDADTAVPVASIEQIESLIEAIKARQESAGLRHARKLKVTGFRQHGLTARLKELSDQHKFFFCVGYNARDVNLSLRVVGPRTNSVIEYHLAFSQGKFEQVLQHVPQLIARLEGFADLGVSFHTDNRKWSQLQTKWMTSIAPEESSNEPTLFPLN